MKQATLSRYDEYQSGPFEMPPGSNLAWLLTARCPKKPGEPRRYRHNLVLTSTYPTGYTYEPGKVIKPVEVLVRFDAVGACASDVKIADLGETHSKMKGMDLAKNPAIMGHEVALTIIAAGDALRDRYKPGERFVVNADTNFGGRKVTFGYRLPGGYRQFGVYGQMLLQNDNGSALVSIPRDMSYLVAASLEPYACCFNTLDGHRPQERSVKKGGNTWLMGAGPMARAFVESLLSRQKNYPAKLAVTEIDAERMEKFENTLGKKTRNAGIEVKYINALDRNSMFAEIDGFFTGSIDDVFLMFEASKKVLSPLIRGALDKMSTTGVFDVFAGLREETEINWRGNKIKLQDIHYGNNAHLKQGIQVVGFSGLQSKHLEEARDAYLQRRIDPYTTTISAVASLNQLPDVLHRIEDRQLDGKCIMLPSATTTLGFQTPKSLRAILATKHYAKQGVNTQRIYRSLQRRKFSDEISKLIFDQFVA